MLDHIRRMGTLARLSSSRAKGTKAKTGKDALAELAQVIHPLTIPVVVEAVQKVEAV